MGQLHAGEVVKSVAEEKKGKAWVQTPCAVRGQWTLVECVLMDGLRALLLLLWPLYKDHLWVGSRICWDYFWKQMPKKNG